ncbi:hypothetical protein [Macellibacteroides fermentans]|uniref:hypothetical protein n=1 Tax=Macellibacteroides fermentans TaxID=879969 RepID=UPI00406C60BA
MVTHPIRSIDIILVSYGQQNLDNLTSICTETNPKCDFCGIREHCHYLQLQTSCWNQIEERKALNNKQIHDFAIKWIDKFRNVKTTDREVEEGFADECFALGFNMDCGHSFEEAFPGSNAFNDYKQLIGIIDQIKDIKLLGTAIFSQWRYITHWSYMDSLLSEENRQWFVIAFERLALITNVDQEKAN